MLNNKQYLILFKSRVLTVKSVYRKKLGSDKVRIYLTFFETNEKIFFQNNKIDYYKFLKKGTVTTLHLGNGNYKFIEEGIHLPEKGLFTMLI